MANIPVLKDNISAQAVTGTVDRSGVLKEQQTGIADFSNFLQQTIKQGADIYDSKVYASDSAKAQGELLDFMSETKNEKLKADYFKANKGNMTGYATYRAKQNMDVMEKKLSNVSHPKARQELEKSMAFQAQKSLLSDLGDENRVVEQQTRAKIEGRRQLLALEVSGMKSPEDQEQYEITMAQSLAATNKDIEDGLISPEKGLKIQRDMLDEGANFRARALVEGGKPLDAIKSVKRNRFGTAAHQTRTMNYIVSKNLDGKKKGYEALTLQNNVKKQQIMAQSLELDTRINNIVNNPDMSMGEKLTQTRALRSQYNNEFSSSRQARIIKNASYEISRGAVTRALSEVRSLDYDETDTKAFARTREKLRAIRDNDNIPAKVQTEASNALKEINKKQKLHDALVEKKAYETLKKGNILEKFQHGKIMKRLTEDPKYQDIAVEAKVGIYKLMAEGQNKSYIGVKDKNDKDSESRPFIMKTERAKEIYTKDPARLNKVILWEIKNRRPSISQDTLKKVFKEFKSSFDEYRDNVDNFEKKEKAILEQYKGF